MKEATHKAACDHAVAEYPKESCGLVVAVKRKEIYYPCKNIAENPTINFVMDPGDFVDAEDMGTIKVLVHSHPDEPARPTMADMVNCENSGVKWRIISVGNEGVVDYADVEPTGYEAPYRGREFFFGIMDCYTLIRDFYKRDMGIELPDFERKDLFWERGEDLYMDNFPKIGFEEIPKPSQKGDIILMNIRSDIVNHAGIWLGEMDHMLHHPYEHLSEKVVYGGYWQEVTRLYVRKVR